MSHAASLHGGASGGGGGPQPHHQLMGRNSSSSNLWRGQTYRDLIVMDFSLEPRWYVEKKLGRSPPNIQRGTCESHLRCHGQHKARHCKSMLQRTSSSSCQSPAITGNWLRTCHMSQRCQIGWTPCLAATFRRQQSPALCRDVSLQDAWHGCASRKVSAWFAPRTPAACSQVGIHACRPGVPQWISPWSISNKHLCSSVTPNQHRLRCFWHQRQRCLRRYMSAKNHFFISHLDESSSCHFSVFSADQAVLPRNSQFLRWRTRLDWTGLDGKMRGKR